MKERAGILLAVAVAFAAMAAATPASGAEQRPDQEILAVSGSGEVRVSPDVAVVRLGVEARAARAADAIRDANTRMGQVIRAIRALDIPERNIQTVTYNVSQQYEPRPQGDRRPPVPIYVVTNIVSVRVMDVARAGAVIDAGTGAGANVVQGISFVTEKEMEVRQEALRQAVQEARTKAETIAGALGVRILGVESVVESGGPVYIPQTLGVAVAEARAQAPAPIEPGENVIRASVVVRYRIGR